MLCQATPTETQRGEGERQVNSMCKTLESYDQRLDRIIEMNARNLQELVRGFESDSEQQAVQNAQP